MNGSLSSRSMHLLTSIPLCACLMLSSVGPAQQSPATNTPNSQQKPPPPTPEQLELKRLYEEGAKAYNRGDFPTALKAWQTGLEKAQAIKDERRTAFFLNGIGAVYSDLGQKEKALEFYQRALTLSEKIGNPQDIAMSLGNIGIVYSRWGQNEKALEFHQRALTLDEKSGNPQDIARSLGNIGNVYDSLGQKEKALDFFQRALTLQEKSGRNPQDIARSLNNIGNVYKSLGQKEKALDFLQRALILFEKSGNPQDIARSLNGLGNVYFNLGQKDKALDFYQRALTLFEKIGNKQDIAGSLHNIGNVYWSLGENEKALDFFQCSLTLREKVGNPSDIAMSLGNIGLVYKSLGQNEKALDCLQRALTLTEKVGNPQQIARSLDNIGTVYRTLGQSEKAEESYGRALGLFEKFSRDVLADPTQLGDLLATTPLYENYALLLTDYKRPEDALNLLERKRAQALALQLGVNQNSLTRLFTTEENSKLKTLRQDAIVQAKSFAVLTSRPAPTEIVAQTAYNTRYRETEQKKQEAVNRYELFRDTLYNRHPQFRLVQGERARSIKEFHRLSSDHPDTLYLEYVTAFDRSLLILALHNGVLTARKLPTEKKQLETLVKKWRDAMEKQNTGEERLAQELYSVVLQPIQSLLDSPKVKRLVIVADGALLDVPFSALMDKSGRRLIERFAVSNALSLGILLWQENPDRPTKELLCVADTRGEAPRTQVVSLTRGGFGPLPSARKEGENVSSLYPKNSALLIGGQATEAIVKKEMGKYAILHFAAHGDLDIKNGLRSAIVLAPEPAGSENDGFLDGREIIELGVTAKLAVLSACQSGQGKKSGGEGLMGLAWAFRAGGCPSVVASQWKVDDTATKELMVTFYRGLKAGKRKDDALRDAMLSVMHNGVSPKSKTPKPQPVRPPYFWAAFQVIGETTPLP